MPGKVCGNLIFQQIWDRTWVEAGAWRTRGVWLHEGSLPDSQRKSFKTGNLWSGMKEREQHKERSGSAWVLRSPAGAQDLATTAEKLGRRACEGLQPTVWHPQAKPPSFLSSLRGDGRAGPKGYLSCR